MQVPVYKKEKGIAKAFAALLLGVFERKN